MVYYLIDIIMYFIIIIWLQGGRSAQPRVSFGMQIEALPFQQLTSSFFLLRNVKMVYKATRLVGTRIAIHHPKTAIRHQNRTRARFYAIILILISDR